VPTSPAEQPWTHTFKKKVFTPVRIGPITLKQSSRRHAPMSRLRPRKGNGVPIDLKLEDITRARLRGPV